jgi:large conductance mechanosensitive channel
MGMGREFKEFALKVLALTIFLMVRQINRMKKEAPAAPPPATPEDVVLLRQIRDSLAK